MNAIFALWWREVRHYRNLWSGGLPIAAFLAAAGWTFVVTLRNNEGSVLQIQTIWGVAAAPWLPTLAALIAGRLFAEERSSGMIDLLLVTSVRERQLVLGKFLAALTVVVAALLLSLITPLVILPTMSPQLLPAIHAKAFVTTLLILGLQATTWCALATMLSTLFRNLAAATITALLLCSALPLVVYAGILKWLPGVRAEMPWMPLLLHVYDFSTGLFATSVFTLYAALTLGALFVCSKLLLLQRVRG